ncbi:MAG TPA: 3-dehydroquinate synthase, partial [Polyangiaceae bacterium]|nr:3-dehydroquinate synthase [Polyangiaceae bacterium]
APTPQSTMRRPLILNGFMATGKSTVGALVARTTGRPFIDLDHAIESETGASIESLFATRGEAAFRALERRCLERVLSEATAAAEAPVIAVGGGALLSRDLRLRALDECVVVALEGSPAELARRALRQGQRPLLSGPDPERRVSELLALRATSYSEAHARISSAAPLESVAAQVREVWSRDELAVAVGDASYSVQTGLGFASGRVGALIAESPVCVLVSDKTVAALHAAPIEAALTATGARLLRVDLEPGEAHKNIAAIERIWHAALAGGADRKATFVGLGGGVVTDMTGFAASTWMRGVRWVGLPTTLLAMVDASVGGKTGVDLASAKNAVGAFWQPSGVLCDVHYLGTESGRGFISGLAEAVKTALIGDPKLFELLEDNAERVVARDGDLTAEIVRRSIRVKARIVSFDQREGGLRAVLNLGHTVGHALEAQADYSALSHGEAVSLGLVAALRLGETLGHTPPELRERTISLLRRLGLPATLAGQPLAEAAALLGHDKKRAGSSVKFVFAHALGRVETQSIALSELRTRVLALAD